jgi:hypothetical protein
MSPATDSTAVTTTVDENDMHEGHQTRSTPSVCTLAMVAASISDRLQASQHGTGRLGERCDLAVAEVTDLGRPVAEAW